jgi:hypothetical protein
MLHTTLAPRVWSRPSFLTAKSRVRRWVLITPNLRKCFVLSNTLQSIKSLPHSTHGNSILGSLIHDFYRTKAKLECGDIKVDARSWPALLYGGQVAGEAFDPTNVQDGLFEGYLVERVSFFYRAYWY